MRRLHHQKCFNQQPIYAPVAQGIERRFPKPCVDGSNPFGSAIPHIHLVEMDMGYSIADKDSNHRQIGFGEEYLPHEQQAVACGLPLRGRTASEDERHEGAEPLGERCARRRWFESIRECQSRP